MYKREDRAIKNTSEELFSSGAFKRSVMVLCDDRVTLKKLALGKLVLEEVYSLRS